MFYWINNPTIPMLYIVAITGSLLIAYICSDEFARSDHQNTRYRLKVFVVAFLTCAVIGNAFTAAISPGAHISDPRPITNRDAAAHFGLQSSHSYPLVIGSKVGGASGSVITTSGFFSATTAVSLRPATAINVSFTHGDSSWILTLSTDIITFHQKAGDPSMVLTLNKHPYNAAHWDKQYSGCHWGFLNLAVGCAKQLTRATIVMDTRADKLGLPTVISGSLVRADITLPPKLYAQIVGHP
jgi:hypothetical protein